MANSNDITTIEQFAEHYRLHIRRDECNDQIIPGRRGQIYFDNGKPCLMVLDGLCAEQQRWEALGGKLWLGDKSMNNAGRNVQDVKIIGFTNPQAAIRMCKISPIKQLTDTQRAVLAKSAFKPRNDSNEPRLP